MIETNDKRYIPLKLDLMFKKVFGDEKNKTPIKRLLKEILNIEAKDVTILNSELIGQPYKDKNVRVDLIVELEDGTKVNVEVNTSVSKYTIDRNVYYMCRNVSKDLSPSSKSIRINSHIQINFDFNGVHKRPIMRYELYDKEAKEKLTDIIEIIRIDVPYYKELCYNKDVSELDSLTKFIGLFGAETSEEAKKLCEGDEEMEDIMKKIEEYSDDMDVIGVHNFNLFEEEIKQEEMREAIEQGIEQGIEQARKQAREEALKEGSEERNIDIAKNMLKKGIEINVISEVTGLSIDKINELKES